MIRIGTRGSALALAQARWVVERLREPAELVEITTAGDRGERLADKSRWVSALEQALLDDQIDLAVHSAKDVPGELATGTEVIAVPNREDPRDVIVGAESLASLASEARVGTSSLRRTAQIRALRQDLEIAALRGNIDTRLRKLADGEYDAIVLAAAGMHRLGREVEIGGYLDELVPSPGQGALLLQGRTADSGRVTELANLGTGAAEDRQCVAAERELARLLNASCDTPFGACASRIGDDTLLRAWIGLPDGSEWIADQVTGPGDQVAASLADRLLMVGADQLLRRAEAMATA